MSAHRALPVFVALTLLSAPVNHAFAANGEEHVAAAGSATATTAEVADSEEASDMDSESSDAALAAEGPTAPVEAAAEAVAETGEAAGPAATIEHTEEALADAVESKSDRPKDPKRFYNAGITLTVIGAVGAVGSAFMVFPCLERGGDGGGRQGRCIETISPLVIGTASVGGAALITGISLLVVNRNKKKNVAAVPMMGPETAGLSLSGKF